MTLVKFNNGQRNNIVNPRFSDVLDTIFNESFLSHNPTEQVPAVNIIETENGFAIELAAPGLKKEDFKISLDKNVLSVAAEVKADENAQPKKYSKKEFGYTSFSRSFTLPQTVDQTNIDAAYADGILTLTLAKKEEAKLLTREIAVK
jgi:HSP20 family protein